MDFSNFQYSIIRCLGEIRCKLNTISLPILILHGGNDSLCQPSGSHTLYQVRNIQRCTQGGGLWWLSPPPPVCVFVIVSHKWEFLSIKSQVPLSTIRFVLMYKSFYFNQFVNINQDEIFLLWYITVFFYWKWDGHFRYSYQSYCWNQNENRRSCKTKLKC